MFYQGTAAWASPDFAWVLDFETHMPAIIAEFDAAGLFAGEAGGEMDAIGAASDYAVDRNLYSGSPGKWHGVDVWAAGKGAPRADRFPVLLAALAAVIPSALNYGRVLFSVALPGLKIAPHCGPHNERLTVHCGVHIPRGPRAEQPWLKVAGDAHHWEQSKCVIFDDSFEHEVEYPAGTGGEPRVILFFHIPHPMIADGSVQSFMEPVAVSTEWAGTTAEL